MGISSTITTVSFGITSNTTNDNLNDLSRFASVVEKSSIVQDVLRHSAKMFYKYSVPVLNADDMRISFDIHDNRIMSNDEISDMIDRYEHHLLKTKNHKVLNLPSGGSLFFDATRPVQIRCSMR